LPSKCPPRPFTLPPRPKPEPIADDFESTPVGPPPEADYVAPPQKGASIAITDETAASGKRSVKFTDAPGLDYIWRPHMFYRPCYSTGTLRLKFDVRVAPGAIFWCEWRDGSTPYKVGPSFRIEADGRLTAGGRELARLPHDQWLHFEVTCPLGKTAGTYDLAVSIPNEETRRFQKLPLGNPRFRKLRWLGFISLADANTVFYLDNLDLRPVGAE